MTLRRMTAFGWTPWHLLGAVAMAALGVWVARDAWADILLIALKDEEASHVFLVPFVVAWLVWARRTRLRYCRPVGVMVGPLIVAAGWFCSVFGYNHGMQALWHGGAVAVAVGCGLSVLGSGVLFRFLPAFIVLGFLVPVPASIRQGIAIPLQSATAIATQGIMETLGLAVERSGNMLTINRIDVTVADACNGLRMVFALVLVSFAFAYSSPWRNSVRLLILAASPLAAIACNVIRLIPTVYVYGYARSIAEPFHDVAGWVMLPVAFFLLLGIMRLLRWALVPVSRFNLAYQ